ncbi:MAG: hypothetical protein PHY92_08805 [Alphaproteobacteria bacterium]|nr:hypothetical protein [Alphaproteobacteria bacterium]
MMDDNTGIAICALVMGNFTPNIKCTDTVVVDNGGCQWNSMSGTPRGSIIMWSGTKDNVPPGWALCDGTYGTPDLRSRFVVGGQSAVAYTWSTGNDIPLACSDTCFSGYFGHSLPAYQLAFIMKL